MRSAIEPYVIAEIGINHNGDFDLARELIVSAASCGVDAVKFQKRNPDICVPESQKGLLRDTPWGQMTYLDYKKRIEFGFDEYVELKNIAHEHGLDFSASAWDLESLDFLDRVGVDFHKVASAMVTNTSFISEVANRGLDTFVSTGMTTWEQIDHAVEVFRSLKGRFVLLHSVSTYPAKESELNLRMIETFRKKYSVEVGYSGHESAVSPSIVAASIGATVIERHFTLNRASWGTDHAASLEPEAMRRLVGALRKVKLVLGDGEKREIEGEASVAAKLRYWDA